MVCGVFSIMVKIAPIHRDSLPDNLTALRLAGPLEKSGREERLPRPDSSFVMA